MTDAVFLIRNQLQQFWTRAGEWVDGREPQRILKYRHRDEALNQLVELSARDIDLRGEVIACELSGRGDPVVEASEHATPTLAEKAAQQAQAARDTAEAEGLESEAEGHGAAEETSLATE